MAKESTKVQGRKTKASNYRACPFCGSTKTQMLECPDCAIRPRVFFIWCANCGCGGPHDISMSECVDKWNSRTVT